MFHVWEFLFIVIGITTFLCMIAFTISTMIEVRTHKFHIKDLFKKTNNPTFYPFTLLEEWIIKSIAIDFIVLICIGLLLAGAFAFSSNKYMNNPQYITTKIEYKNKKNIISLQDQISTQKKNFILGFRSTSDQTDATGYYYVLIGNQKTGYLLHTYDGKQTFVFLDENKQPYIIEKICKKINHYKPNFIYGGLLKPFKNTTKTEKPVYELHVPKNTIQTNYNIDMK